MQLGFKSEIKTETVFNISLNIGTKVELFDMVGPRTLTVYDIVNDTAYLADNGMVAFLTKRAPKEWVWNHAMISRRALDTIPLT